MAYKLGSGRTQIDLFPICIDEIIAQDNVVRVIDAFVEWLDLSHLGFKSALKVLRFIHHKCYSNYICMVT